MTSWILREHWRGTSSENIGAMIREKKTAGQIDKMIALELSGIADDALNAIATNATKGDVAAVEWLESRGLINLYCKDERTESDS